MYNMSLLGLGGSIGTPGITGILSSLTPEGPHDLFASICTAEARYVLSEAECCCVLSLSFGTAAAAAVRSGGIGGRVVR